MWPFSFQDCHLETKISNSFVPFHLRYVLVYGRFFPNDHLFVIHVFEILFEMLILTLLEIYLLLSKNKTCYSIFGYLVKISKVCYGYEKNFVNIPKIVSILSFKNYKIEEFSHLSTNFIKVDCYQTLTSFVLSGPEIGF